MTARIQPGWSIYSQLTPEGGPVATSVGLVNHPLVKPSGTVREEGERHQKFEELFDVDVLYYTDSVVFVQAVQLKRPVKANLSGWVDLSCRRLLHRARISRKTYHRRIRELAAYGCIRYVPSFDPSRPSRGCLTKL